MNDRDLAIRIYQNYINTLFFKKKITPAHYEYIRNIVVIY